MVERNPVSIAVQVILCFIPLVWLYGFYRIEKLGAGILMVIGVAIIAIVLAFIPFFGYALAWLASFLLPIYYMIKWSQEWNEDILLEEEVGENEEDDDTETRYRLD
jgi:hypothetical protein